ncbi:MAG TPA: hypothetical protein VF077_12665 [Nitrospiraceae bacterium]
MAEHCCGTCRYHFKLATGQLGECHGAPPGLFRYYSVGGLVVLPAWPITHGEEWGCKVWEPQEAPLSLRES